LSLLRRIDVDSPTSILSAEDIRFREFCSPELVGAVGHMSVNNFSAALIDNSPEDRAKKAVLWSSSNFLSVSDVTGIYTFSLPHLQQY
jgi:hypothetical protein